MSMPESFYNLSVYIGHAHVAILVSGENAVAGAVPTQAPEVIIAEFSFAHQLALFVIHQQHIT